MALGVTGIAGPDADGSGKPVGLTYVAVASEHGSAVHEFKFTGDRWSNRRQAAAEGLRLLEEEARLAVKVKTA
jgi:nicotinamide mononucleotide (NMN) deamidase PncC